MGNETKSYENAKTSLEREKKIGKFVVKKFVLRDMNFILQQIKDVPGEVMKEFEGKGKLNNEEGIAMMMGALPRIIDNVTPIVAKACSVSEEEILDECGLDELAEILITIFEINNFSGIWQIMKKKVPILQTWEEAGKPKKTSDGFKK